MSYATAPTYDIISIDPKVDIASLSRSANATFLDKDTGFVYNTLMGTDYPKFVAMDCAVINKSGGVCEVSFDGVHQRIQQSEKGGVTDMPFVSFAILSAGGTINSIDVIMQGVYFNQLKALAKKRISEGNVWL